MSPGCTGFLPQFLHHPGTPDFMKLTQTHLRRHTTQPALCKGACPPFSSSNPPAGCHHPTLVFIWLFSRMDEGWDSESLPHKPPSINLAYPSTVLLLSLWWGQWWKVASSDLTGSSSKSLLWACIVSISSCIVILWNSKSTTFFSLFSLLYRHFWEAGRKREQLIRGGAKAYRKIWWRVNNW